MERVELKSFEPKEVGSIIEVMLVKWRIISCIPSPCKLMDHFSLEHYDLVAEQLPDKA